MRSLLPALGRTASLVMAGEVALMALLLVVGLPLEEPNFFGAFQHLAAIGHVPGILLLTEMGLCCGFAGGLIISDVVVGPVARPTLVGVPILAAANVAVVLPAAVALLLARRLLHRLAPARRRRPAA